MASDHVTTSQICVTQLYFFIFAMPLSGLLIFAIIELIKVYILCIFVLICIIEVALYINNMHGFTFHNIVQMMYHQCTSVHNTGF